MTTRARNLIETIEDVLYHHKVLDEIIIFDPGTDAAHRLDEGKWIPTKTSNTMRIDQPAHGVGQTHAYARFRATTRWCRQGQTIPACAGEPLPIHRSCCGRRVHPRVCGGAIIAIASLSSRRGPSPRVRGSLVIWRLPVSGRGSIPACAGEPGLRLILHGDQGVHPRVCGGFR
jgi:hypothetical protein